VAHICSIFVDVVSTYCTLPEVAAGVKYMQIQSNCYFDFLGSAGQLH